VVVVKVVAAAVLVVQAVFNATSNMAIRTVITRSFKHFQLLDNTVVSLN
jgi:hypothetical protein